MSATGAVEGAREKARAVADRALEDLGARLDAGGSDALREYLRVVERFRSYSFRNCLLIAQQRPDATHVAGFHAWHDLGRYVMKGEKGIQILAPMIRGKRERSTGEARDDGGAVIGFRVVYVFDVSQTDGQALPEAPRIHVEGGDVDAFVRLAQWAQARGIGVAQNVDPVGFSVSGAHGETDGRAVKLATHLAGDVGALIGTLAHELAHCLLHFPGKPLDLGDAHGRAADRGLRELEAEAVAYVVVASLGCTYLERMSDYIVGWKGSRERLQGSMQRIQAAARVLLAAVEAEAAAAASDAA